MEKFSILVLYPKTSSEYRYMGNETGLKDLIFTKHVVNPGEASMGNTKF